MHSLTREDQSNILNNLLEKEFIIEAGISSEILKKLRSLATKFPVVKETIDLISGKKNSEIIKNIIKQIGIPDSKAIANAQKLISLLNSNKTQSSQNFVVNAGIFDLFRKKV